MHGAAGNRTVTTKSASPTARDTVSLPNITLLNSMISAASRIGSLSLCLHDISQIVVSQRKRDDFCGAHLFVLFERREDD